MPAFPSLQGDEIFTVLPELPMQYFPSLTFFLPHVVQKKRERYLLNAPCISNIFLLQDLKSDEEYGKNLTVLQADVTSEEDVLQAVKVISENSDELNIVIYSIGQVGNNNLIGSELILIS